MMSSNQMKVQLKKCRYGERMPAPVQTSVYPSMCAIGDDIRDVVSGADVSKLVDDLDFDF